LWIGESARQPSSRGRGQPRHRRDHLPRHIGALPVQPDQVETSVIIEHREESNVALEHEIRALRNRLLR
jgi:hypothetical protein